jgi:[ribosomal protein S5]-alanine N-acetyltransferase
MEVLRSERLVIRALEPADLDSVRGVLERAWHETLPEAELREWLAWIVLGEVQLARLHQPPYGDRAVIWSETGELVGLVGLVPLLGPFAQLPMLGGAAEGGRWSPEAGLYWAVDPAWQRQGIAREAGGMLARYAFSNLHLERILATTTFTNLASQAVMRKIGMRVETNPYPTPEWLQVVGWMKFQEEPRMKGMRNDEEG